MKNLVREEYLPLAAGFSEKLMPKPTEKTAKLRKKFRKFIHLQRWIVARENTPKCVQL